MNYFKTLMDLYRLEKNVNLSTEISECRESRQPAELPA